MSDERANDRPAEGADEQGEPQDDLARALAEGPLDWPEDDTPPPPDEIAGIGLPPPGGGAVASGGWPGKGERSGADTDTEARRDEDVDNER